MKKRTPKRTPEATAKKGAKRPIVSGKRNTKPESLARDESAGRARTPDKRAAEVEGVKEAARERPDAGGPAFPIVGIGASAGGLEALEQFLKNVPPRSGMAYVVIQHLDPTHKGAMVELLQRATEMPVVQARDRQKVEPDRVYIIPPNKDMSILHGALHLLPRATTLGLNLPIDFFFRSLAEDQQERSIGVVLSGMGSDGTLGLRAIKEKAGAGFVQSLASAKFVGMPRSAIETGLADVVGSAEELPGRILAYHQHAPYVRRPEAILEEKQLSALEKVFILLRTHTGNDFSLYKRSTIYRRIERRMGLHQIDKLANYVRYLRENPREIDLLFKELLIGVTSFFRDPVAWKHLRKDVLPDLLRARSRPGVVRAWVPGCSTGEEAYSLAMVLSEAADEIGSPHLSFQIFATDLDRDAIERARQGIYPTNIVADVSPARLRRYFSQDEQGYRVCKEIRESVVFAPQNIIMDPPFTKLDVLSCRNLLIYLSPDLQKKLIPLFHYALNQGGVLFLGSAETIGAYTSLFTPMDGKSRLYRRLDTAIGGPIVDFPPTFTPAPVKGALAEVEPREPSSVNMANLSLVADRAMLERLCPAAILTNDKGDILYISGRTGKYLEPAVGKANLNVFAMAREGLRYDLSSTFASALREEHPVTAHAVKVQTDGPAQTVDITVQKLAEPRELAGTLLISLADAPATPDSSPEPSTSRRPAIRVHLTELERELQQAREEIQTTREEMQTSQEELKSTNEELQSTNEELQSTNEELTTSKEEMQSMNEELQTVNHELQSKVDELSRSNNDMKNLLNSTDIATLFLDGELNVRRFTTQTSKLIKLIPADAGRPITDIATELDYPDLAEDAREVLRTLIFKEKEVPSRGGRWFTVRILPYRTLENVIDGVVITFTETTSAKTLETALREQASQLTQMTESLPNLVLGFRPDGACDYLGQRWVAYTGVSEAEQLGYGWLERVDPDVRERVREEWKAVVRAGAQLETAFRIRAADGTYRWFKVGSMPIRDQRGTVLKWYCTCTDVDDLKQVAERAPELARRLTGALDGIDEALVVLDDDLRITHVNTTAQRLFKRKRDDVLGKRIADAFPSAGSALESKLDEAARSRRPSSLEVPIAGPKASAVRIFPYAGGVSIFCRPLGGEKGHETCEKTAD